MSADCLRKESKQGKKEGKKERKRERGVNVGEKRRIGP
jgi:hypothetical protein